MLLFSNLNFPHVRLTFPLCLISQTFILFLISIIPFFILLPFWYFIFPFSQPLQLLFSLSQSLSHSLSHTHYYKNCLRCADLIIWLLQPLSFFLSLSLSLSIYLSISLSLLLLLLVHLIFSSLLFKYFLGISLAYLYQRDILRPRSDPGVVPCWRPRKLC